MSGKDLSNWTMELSILDSGKMGREMGGANKFGKMEPFMKDIGRTIWQTDRED